jgi:hypothetical protein
VYHKRYTHSKEENIMTLVTRLEKKVKYRSKDRPKSLLLLIPAVMRDILELTYNDTVILDVCVENDEKFVKIYKKPE